MSREIEFRGLSKNLLDDDHYWIYSSEEGLGDFFSEELWIPETLGQSTGFKDIKGAKVFEGDVVRYGTGRRGINAKKMPGIVIWQEDGAYFRIKHLDSDSGISW